MNTTSRFSKAILFLAAFAGAVLLFFLSGPALAGETVSCAKYINGITDDYFMREDTLSFKLQDIVESNEKMMEAFFENGNPTVHVCCSNDGLYDEVLTPDTNGIIKWKAPEAIKSGFSIWFSFKFSNTLHYSSESFSCRKKAVNLGAKTIDLRSGRAPLESEKVLENICNTLSSLTENDLINFSYKDPYYTADLDRSEKNDIALGWNSTANRYEIWVETTCSVHGDITFKPDGKALTYLLQEGYDYFSTLTLRFPEASAPAASSSSETSGKTTDSASKKTSSAKAKKANTMKVKARTVTVKYSRLKKKQQTVSRKKAVTVSKAKGKVTYKLTGVTKKKFKKYFRINTKTGKITIKKGLKRGTYKLKIKIRAAGNSKYKALSRTVTVKVKVV